MGGRFVPTSPMLPAALELPREPSRCAPSRGKQLFGGPGTIAFMLPVSLDLGFRTHTPTITPQSNIYPVQSVSSE